MIIETFGPPGAGKTTFSRALAQRLRQRGYTVDLVLLPRLKSEFLSRGGFLPALLRGTYAIFVTIAILCRPISNAPGLRLARDLLRLMPPKSPAWMILQRPNAGSSGSLPEKKPAAKSLPNFSSARAPWKPTAPIFPRSLNCAAATACFSLPSKTVPPSDRF